MVKAAHLLLNNDLIIVSQGPDCSCMKSRLSCTGNKHIVTSVLIVLPELSSCMCCKPYVQRPLVFL